MSYRQVVGKVCCVDDNLTRQPLYQQVADRLRADITAGHYTAEGGKLPSESELIAKYDVARDTVRRAIARLQAEGLISAEQGRGTFVRTPPLRLASSRFSRGVRVPGKGPWGIACAAAGVPGGATMIVVERIPATDDVAFGLGVDPETPVIHRCRHMHAGDPARVLQIQDSYLPESMVAGTALAAPDLIPQGTYAGLDAIGHAPDTSTETVTARMSTPSEARILGIRNGIPVIVIHRATYDADSRVIEWLQVVAAADANAFVYERLPLR